MKQTIAALLNEYGSSHQHRLNQNLHTVCVPLITWSVVLALWLLSKPTCALVVVVALGYYFRLSLRYGFAMLLVLGMMVCLAWVLETRFNDIAMNVAESVFGLAWIGQFIGHYIEGQRPSFLRDLQFLLIGPLWVFSKVTGLKP